MLLASSALATAQDARVQQVIALADGLFSQFSTGNQPGAGLMVIHEGTVVLERCYGYADVETRAPITPNTMFRLASVSKQFAAMAVMILEESGRLAYDDPVAKYVPELSGFPAVTIRQLMQHTSGLPDYYDAIDTSGGMPTNHDAAVQLGRMADQALFPPGERYEYSNSGYDMLAPVVEAAAGVRFAQFLREQVFTPAGMKSTIVHDHTLPEIADRATGYEPGDGSFELDEDSPLNGIVGSGGIYSSLRDLYRWDQALYGADLVGPATLELAFSSGLAKDGSPLGYGFGWRTGSFQGHRMVWHGGSWLGFRSHILRIPDLRFSVIALSNRGDFAAEAAVRAIAEAYFARSPAT